MPIFSYVALTKTGATVAGESAAVNAAELSAELARQELRVQTLEVKRDARRLPGFGRQRIKPEALLLFNQEFVALIRAGLTISDALKLCADRPDHPALGALLQSIGEAVRGGQSLSEACAAYTDVFEPLFVSALKTGEKTGGLVDVLGKYQESLKNRVAFNKKVGQAMAYPMFLLITLGVIMSVLFIFVMPRFVAMYADFGAELPVATRVLVHFVKRLYLYIPLLAGLSFGAWVLWRRWTAFPAARIRVDDFKCRLPVWGAVYKNVALAQSARTLATLLSGGTPLVEAMQTTSTSLANRADAARLVRATQAVTEGSGLAAAMRDAKLMPNTALKMIEVGEASGNLDAMLAQIAEYYEEAVSNQLARAMTLIEPLMMLLMGILIGGIILVMYLPIFYMVDIVK